MDRARRSVPVATLLLFAASALAMSPGGPSRQTSLAALVAWPPSSSVMLAEVVTGGASASDEYFEITNAGNGTADLAGMEVVYVTSSGATITRKAVWSTPRPLEPGQHLLVANSLGTFAPTADATYSGGLAATGGALAIRVVGGSTIDAIGWGDAVNGFVEGNPAAAPPARASIERRPGGSGGNVQDTNDNVADWMANATPVPQNLAATPVPGPQPTPTPTVQPSPTVEPTATPTVEPTPAPTPTPTVEPTPTPTPTVEPTPTSTVEPTATPAPTPTAPPSPSTPPEPSPSTAPEPSPLPVPSPSPAPSPSPGPSVTSIADARSLPDGTVVTITGTLTTQLGALESGRTGFVQDSTAGIGLYLESATSGGLVAGTAVTATGIVDERYGQRTLRVAESAVVALGSGSLPIALSVPTGAAGEAVEGSRVAVAGPVIEAPSTLSDGLGLTIDDGTGPLRVIVTPDALGNLAVMRDSVVTAAGPLGQRDSSGTGLAGYRVLVTLPGELAVVPPPEPSPSPQPTPAPTPSTLPSAPPSAQPSSGPAPTPTVPTPSPTSTPAPTPTPTPDPSENPVVAIADARLMPVGSVVTVRGVVTAESGRIGTPPLFAIQDSTAGLLVHRPDGLPSPVRGTLLEVRGKLAEPNGQLEIRPDDAASMTGLGPTVLPAPLRLVAAQLGEASEGRLVVIDGLVAETPTKGSSGDLTVFLEDAAGDRFRVMADASSGIGKTDLARGKSYRLTGIVGQRASRRDALDGYRVWVRDRQDIFELASSGSGGSTSAGTMTIASALVAGKGPVTVEGSVTAGPALLDATGRRIVIQDGSAAVEVRLPAGSGAPRVGQRLRITGTMGRAYGAPRLTAERVVRLSPGSPVQPLDLRTAPGTAHEWRLVRLVGLVSEVHKLGERWRAEVLLGSDRVPVIGLPGSRIPSTAIVEGRRALIVGIVRRPYPSAKDRRFAIVPRSGADLAMGAANPGGATAGSGSTSGTGGESGASGDGGRTSPVDIDLGQLAEHFGDTVRVGGLIETVGTEGITLDDGTGVALVILQGDAAGFLPLVRPGEAVNAIGRVDGDRAQPHLLVTDGAGLVRVGGLGDLSAPTPQASPAVVAPAGEQPGGHTAAGTLPDLVAAPTGAGVASLILVSVLSVAVTLLRRRRVRRALAARVAERLAAIMVAAPRSGGLEAGAGAANPPRSRGSARGPESAWSELGPRSG